MLLLLVSLAMLSAAWGQTNNCPNTIESLTNLMQLTLARQLMADLKIEPATNPSSPANGCDCNETATALKQLQTESIDNKEAIHNLTADNVRIKAQCMDNSETIRNLTAVVERLVHQNLKTVCGSSGWTRVAYLNMTDPSEQCPSGFRLYNENGIRACGRTAISGGCLSSVQFPIGMNYSEVCGRVTGYQYFHPDAFSTSNRGINQYIEGVSLTYGSPRRHIWSFAAANRKSSLTWGCPCSTGSSTRPPSFVGSDYFCESGYSGQGGPPQQLFPEPLWDGKGCSNLETPCCQATGIPWFHKRLSTSTDDYIELRVCADSSGEDSPVGHYEIYVK